MCIRDRAQGCLDFPQHPFGSGGARERDQHQPCTRTSNDPACHRLDPPLLADRRAVAVDPRSAWGDADGPALEGREWTDVARPGVARERAVSYTHLRAHETPEHLVCRLLLEK